MLKIAATWGFCLATAGLMTASAGADEIRVEPLTFPAAFHRDAAEKGGAAKLDVVLEPSGVEPVGDGTLVLIAHDKSEELYLAESATGRIVGEPLKCDALPKTPKWEGMARDDQGNFYLTGAHQTKTEEMRKLQSQMIRFRLKGDGSTAHPYAIDADSVRSWKLGDSLATALGRDGADVAKLKVEGLTVYTRPASGDRPERTELAVGLRQPSDLVRVFTADISRDPAPDAKLTFERLFAFPAGQREGSDAQLTSLHYLPAWKGFFVVTATEDATNAFHGNTLWFLANDAIPAGRSIAKPERVLDFEVAMKAEGLSDLPVPAAEASRTARLLVTYDNDPHSTHIPSRIQTLKVTRSAH